MSNGLKTTVLLGLMTGLIMAIGQYVGGSQGMTIAFVFAAMMNFGSYWFSDKIVLAMYGARPVDMNEAPELYRIVSNLCAQSGLPMPRVYIIASDAPNAFATGRNPEHAAVAVTEGILRILTPQELEAVLGHELGHVKNRDILIGSVAATLAGVVMMVANMLRWAAIFGGVQRDEREEGGGVLGLLAMTILAPIAATLIQLAISRSREFEADATGARLTHNPLGLASALEKLEIASQSIPLAANPQTAHLFIVSPLTGKSFSRFFSTHPPMEERIRRLRAMTA
ncbi:MAG: zinc metalloprotease HtpX [Deltaproteobacteria bacterium]|nr:zinc metalloprotease HtpX [Deltaproteobacteria bacterium]MBI3389668.1 zinc metalloprotease HtpX [Deltaproteobacteria bacterium]